MNIESNFTERKRETDFDITDFIYQNVELCMNSNLNFTEPIVEIPTMVFNSSAKNVPKIFLCPGLDGLSQIWSDIGENLKIRAFVFQYSYINPSPTIPELAKTLVPVSKFAFLPFHTHHF